MKKFLQIYVVGFLALPLAFFVILYLIGCFVIWRIVPIHIEWSIIRVYMAFSLILSFLLSLDKNL